MTAAKKAAPAAHKAQTRKPPVVHSAEEIQTFLDPEPKVEKVETVELPAPPDGFAYVLMRGDHCLAQTCPMHLDDPLAYSKSPGYGEPDV